MVNRKFGALLRGILLLLLVSSPSLSALDLGAVKCDDPWANFTTESNTQGILFEDKSDNDRIYTLPLTNVPATNLSCEMLFAMKSLAGQDRSAAVGFWLWDGIEKSGKNKSLKGHFLVLYDNTGNLDIKHWDGKYYTIVAHKSRFAFNPNKLTKFRLETTKSGLIKAYVNCKIQISYHTKLRIRAPSILGVCATSGAWMELDSFSVK